MNDSVSDGYGTVKSEVDGRPVQAREILPTPPSEKADYYRLTVSMRECGGCQALFPLSRLYEGLCNSCTDELLDKIEAQKVEAFGYAHDRDSDLQEHFGEYGEAKGL